MAKIVVLGGGFGGVVAAERLAEQVGDEHQITLISRSRTFVFSPALVRLALGKCEKEDLTFDLRKSMLNRRINFIEAEVAHFDPSSKKISIAHGDVQGKITYDYLIFALGRRLATERVKGFFEHAHHLFNIDKAIQFRKAISDFREGQILIGQCEGSRLAVPVYETALALARKFKESGDRERVSITVINPDTMPAQFGPDASLALQRALAAQQIEVVENFPIVRVAKDAVWSSQGTERQFDLLMLLPPFSGSAAATYTGRTDQEGYILVDQFMRVVDTNGLYAVGDCVALDGPKMGHMAVRQAEVAAANLAAELSGRGPVMSYEHEIRLIIEDPGVDSVYVHKELRDGGSESVRQGRFWKWAKRVQQSHWTRSHS